MLRKYWYWFALVIALGVLIAAAAGCAPEAEEEPPPEEPEEIEEPADVDMTGLIDEWAGSGKLRPAAVDRAFDDDYYNCLQCHSGVHFTEVEQHELETNELGYVTGIDCAACHTGFGQELMDSGVVTVTHEGAIGDAVPEALLDYEAGKGAQCFYCHSGRRTFDEEWEPGDRMGNYPHYLPNAQLLAGTGAVLEEYEIDFGSTGAHINLDDTCVSCHMPDINEGYALHTFSLEENEEAVFEQACADCHQGEEPVFNFQAKADYDGDGEVKGFQDEVAGLIDLVHDALVDKYDFVDSVTSRAGQVAFLDEEGEFVDYEELEIVDYMAAYNMLLIKYDGSYGIHNPQMAVELLQQSYEAVTGEPAPGEGY